MNNEIIDFDALEDIRQANIRGSKYQLKRRGNDKFTITNEGKLIIGYNATKGINLKAGNGVVVMGVLPVDDKRCTSGLLHGAVGQAFRSNTLENAIVDNGIEANTYTFENPQEYKEITYYTLTPVAETDFTNDEVLDAVADDAITAIPADEVVVEDAVAKSEVEPSNDEF